MTPMTYEGFILTYDPYAAYTKRYIGVSPRKMLRAGSIVELCLLIEAYHG